MDKLPFKKQTKIQLIKLGITQTQLSKKLKIPRNRVNDAIMGRREGRKYQSQIAKFLKIELET
jgi:hypothetical protein